MLNKRVTSNRSWHDDGSICELHFAQAKHKEIYTLLKTKPFGIAHIIKLNNLETLGLVNKVLELISHGGWDKVFLIDELVYVELTLEVVSTITVDMTPGHIH